MTLIFYYSIFAFAIGCSFTLGCIAGVWIGLSLATFFETGIEGQETP